MGKTYNHKCYCKNCQKLSYLEIDVETKADTFLLNVKCPKCQLTELKSADMQD